MTRVSAASWHAPAGKDGEGGLGRISRSQDDTKPPTLCNQENRKSNPWLHLASLPVSLDILETLMALCKALVRLHLARQVPFLRPTFTKD